MGCLFTKAAAAELSSYEAACRLDPELQIFDRNLHRKMNRALSSLAGGVEVRSLSFDSLKEVTGCLLDMNQEVAMIILDCKEDIMETPDLFLLVEEYLNNSLQTLNFCATLECSLNRLRNSQLLIQVAVQRFEEEGDYDKMLEDLREIKAAGNPFTEEFFSEFRGVYEQQLLLLEKLQLRKRKLDKKLKSVRTWRKVSCIILATAFASAFICSAVAAAVAAPPVAAALAAAASFPFVPVGGWFDSLMKRYEDALRGHKEAIRSMQAGAFVAINNLDNIRVSVDGLEIQISSLLRIAQFVSTDAEAVRIGIVEMKKKMGDFVKSIEDLSEQAEQCSRDIRKARNVVFERIFASCGTTISIVR